MLKSMIAMMGLCLAARAARADNAYPMDKEFGQHEVELRGLVAGCTKTEKNIAARMKCMEIAKRTVEQKYVMRGAHSYFLLNYSQLTRPQLRDKKTELFNLSRNARDDKDFMKTTDRPPGELTKETLQAEIHSIEGELSLRETIGCELNRTAQEQASCEPIIIKNRNEWRKAHETDSHYPDLVKKLGQ